MISWMQKHNKYLIITIWISTIAFIGAGFVGWGSYQYNSNVDAVGKVGNIDITQQQLNLTYKNLYNRYSNALGGKFDEAQAKQFGLKSMAFNSLASQAQLLNLADEYGIVVSKQELADYITATKAFQDNGIFSRATYQKYLKNIGLKTKTFESILQNEMIAKKLMGLLNIDTLPYEIDILTSSLGISDKIAYKLIKLNDMKASIDDQELKNYWQISKNRPKTPKSYLLDILWTDTRNISINDKELYEYYSKHKYQYADINGTIISFQKIKNNIKIDLKLKKAKKQALKEYVLFKKGTIKPSETKKIIQNSANLTPELWQEISKIKRGDVIKPKVVGKMYATIRIVDIIEPKEMSFAQAKDIIRKELIAQKKEKMLKSRAKKILKNIDNENLTTTNWMTESTFDKMKPFSTQETSQFVKKLFASTNKNGMIAVSDNIVVYKIVEQKMGKIINDVPKNTVNNFNKIKNDIFKSSLLDILTKKYPIQKFISRI